MKIRVDGYFNDDQYQKLKSIMDQKELKNLSAVLAFLVDEYDAPDEEPSLYQLAPSYDLFPVLRERYNDLVIAGKIDEAKAVRRICDDITSQNITEAQYLAQEANNDPEEPF